LRVYERKYCYGTSRARTGGFQLAWQNRLSEGTQLLEKTLTRVGDEPSRARARLLALLGHYRTNSGFLEEGDVLEREAIEMAKALDDPHLLGSEVMFSRLYYFQHIFDVRAYLDAIDETTALQKVHGSPSDLSMTVGNAIVALVCAGQFERVRSLHAEVMPLSTAYGDVGTAAQLELFDSFVDTATGHFSRARKRQKKVISMFSEAGMPWTSTVIATAAAPGGIADEEEEELLIETNIWVTDQGLPEGELLYEVTNPNTGEVIALLDLAWPEGLQTGYSDPVALTVDEDVDTLEIASSQGFRCFADVEAFRAYVNQEILALEIA